MSLKVLGVESFGSPWGYSHEKVTVKTAAVGGESKYFFSNKVLLANAGASDALQVGVPPPPSGEANGVARLEQMKEQGQATPRMDDSGTQGGVNWGALLSGLLGKHAPETTGSGHSWNQQGLSFRESGATQAVVGAALDASDGYALVAGVSTAALTGGLSLLAGGVAWLLISAKRAAKKQIELPTTQSATFSKVTRHSVHEEIKRIRFDIDSYQGGINEAVIDNLGIVFNALDQNAHLLDKDAAAKLSRLKASAWNNLITAEQAEGIYRRGPWAQRFREVASPDVVVEIKISNYQIDQTRKEVARLLQRLKTLENESTAIK